MMRRLSRIKEYAVTQGIVIYKALLYIARFGRSAAKAYKMAHAALPGREFCTAVTDRGTEVSLRPGTTDVLVYEQIFLLRDLGVPGMPQPRFIVDGGAHIGCSTIYFAERYPSAEIIAIEPDFSNFLLLQKNTSRFGNVRCIRGALWDRNTCGAIANPTESPWEFRMAELQGTNDAIPMQDIATVLRESGHNRIDLLKLDIEGAERRVFTNGRRREWMGSTSVIVIELHDHQEPGCTESFLLAIKEYPHKFLGKTRHNQIVRLGTSA